METLTIVPAWGLLSSPSRVSGSSTKGLWVLVSLFVKKHLVHLHSSLLLWELNLWSALTFSWQELSSVCGGSACGPHYQRPAWVCLMDDPTSLWHFHFSPCSFQTLLRSTYPDTPSHSQLFSVFILQFMFFLPQGSAVCSWHLPLICMDSHFYWSAFQEYRRALM